MDTYLLSCIRASKELIVNSELRESKKRPLRSALIKPFRIFRELAFVPRRWRGGRCFFLTDPPRPNSKSGHVYNELINSGIPKENIFYDLRQPSGTIAKLFRVSYRLLWAIPVVGMIIWRQGRIDRVAIQVILGHLAYRRWLYASPQLIPIIISDVSPRLHMLWSAASQGGHGVLWWQDDFHHDFWLPYQIHAAVVLNTDGKNRALDRNPESLIINRATDPPIAINKVPDNPVLGVATNAQFCAEEKQLGLIESIADSIGAKGIELRLHPNSILDRSKFSSSSIEVASRNETMTEFSERVDVVLVGNTAAQLWLIRNGRASIHISGLDDDVFDLYGYVENGWVFGEPDPKRIQLTDIQEFYEARRWMIYEQIKKFTVLENSESNERLDALKKLIKYRKGIRGG